MGKATIVSSQGDGLYSVTVDLDMSKIDDRIDYLEDRNPKLHLEILDLEDERDDKKSELNAKKAEIDVAIAAAGGDLGPGYVDGEYIASDKYKAVLRLVEEQAELSAEFGSLEKRIEVAWAELTSLTAELKNLLGLNGSYAMDLWCADYTEDLTGEVGTIEVPGEWYATLSNAPQTHVQIRPGYDDGGGSLAAYDIARDGSVRLPDADSGPGVAFNWAMQPGWEKYYPRYRLATLTAVDKGAATCDLTIDPCESAADGIDVNVLSTYTGVDIEYMDCNASPFAPGDQVVVEFRNMTSTGIDLNWFNPVVIGFADNPKDCNIAILTCSFVGDSTRTNRFVPQSPPLETTTMQWYEFDWQGKEGEAITYGGPANRYGPPDSLGAGWRDGRDYYTCPHGTILGAAKTADGDYVMIIGTITNPDGSWRLEAYLYDTGTTSWTQKATWDGYHCYTMWMWNPDANEAVAIGSTMADYNTGVGNRGVLEYDLASDTFTDLGGDSGSSTATHYRQTEQDDDENIIDATKTRTVSASSNQPIAVDYLLSGQRTTLVVAGSLSESVTASYVDDGSDVDMSYSESKSYSESYSIYGANAFSASAFPLTAQYTTATSFEVANYASSPTYTGGSSTSGTAYKFLGLDLRFGHLLTIKKTYASSIDPYYNTQPSCGSDPFQQVLSVTPDVNSIEINGSSFDNETAPSTSDQCTSNTLAELYDLWFSVPVGCTVTGTPGPGATVIWSCSFTNDWQPLSPFAFGYQPVEAIMRCVPSGYFWSVNLDDAWTYPGTGWGLPNDPLHTELSYGTLGAYSIPSDEYLFDISVVGKAAYEAEP